MTPTPERSNKQSDGHLTTLGFVYANQVGRVAFGRATVRFSDWLDHRPRTAVNAVVESRSVGSDDQT